ncbi:TetR/AcrR family transcriptional regulator [Streptomyces sp. NPDC048512]|uniref:TetR/AcrR family transcriptional regulator n=1 Tax=unclassified Streptomyces TaxID=2593676 RepID=UPI0009C1688D|nr:TetR/AcrR family transcriptional regulator [Streptomyces sp. M41(2017)]OQQ13825.1 TetR family transcriptional regulator [Streptomyces sp. M41(2017)]
MARPKDLTKRTELLDGVRAYVLEHGLIGLSLRPLARQLGTSDRMLLHYFGTKERLVAEALAWDATRPFLQARLLLEGTEPPRDAAALRDFMADVWQQLRAPGRQPVVRLFLELMTASLHDPDRYGPLVRQVLTEWTELLTPAFVGLRMSPERARTEATLLVSATFGLLVSPLADDRWEDADAAFRTLLDRLQSGWSSPA